MSMGLHHHPKMVMQTLFYLLHKQQMIYFFIDARARYAVLKELRRFPEENLLRVSVA